MTSPLLWCVRFCVREPQTEPQSIDFKKQAVMHKCITACFIIIWRRGWDSNPRAPIKGQLDFEPFRHFFTHENINQQFKSVVLNFLDKLG